MAKFVFLFVCLAVIQASSALKCKRCSNECDKIDDESCTAPSGNQDVACLTEVYKMKDATKKQMTDKKCVYFPKGQKYQCVKIPNTDQVSCDTCSDKDFCNSAVGFSGTAMLIAVLALFVPRLL